MRMTVDARGSTPSSPSAMGAVLLDTTRSREPLLFTSESARAARSPESRSRVGAAPPERRATIRVVIADHHPLFRYGLRCLLEQEPEFHVSGEARDGLEALALVNELSPDVLLLGVEMARISGLDALRQLADQRSAVKAVLVGEEFREGLLVEAIRLGARGLLLKDAAPEFFSKAIRTVVGGQYWVGRDAVTDMVRLIRSQGRETPRLLPTDRLTQREQETLAGVAAGESNREVARRLGVSENTVKHHLTAIFDKIGVSRRSELVAYALIHGLTTAPAAGPAPSSNRATVAP